MTLKKNKWFTLLQVHSQVYALGEFNHWEKVVSYLLLGKKTAFLFDTGTGYGNVLGEVESITSLPVKVLLTHAHWDHIGGAGLFKSVSIFDNHFEINSLKKGFDANKIPKLIDNKFFISNFKPRQYVVKGISNPELFNDGKVWLMDDLKIIAIHTPGHTPGSVCYIVPKLKLLFSGDTIYNGPIYLQLPESNFDSYYHSIQRLLKMTSEDWLVLPGHNETTCSGKLIKSIFQMSKSNHERHNNLGFSIIKK